MLCGGMCGVILAGQSRHSFMRRVLLVRTFYVLGWRLHYDMRFGKQSVLTFSIYRWQASVPCGPVSSSALRANIARFFLRCGAWAWATLGALPLKPRQEPEVPARCSIFALRPAGLIARFAPHLRVAVSATGRAPLRCLPLPLRPMPPCQLVRAPREHCAVLSAATGRAGSGYVRGLCPL